LDPFNVITGSIVVASRLLGPETLSDDRSATQPVGRARLSHETAASMIAVSSVAAFATTANEGYLTSVFYFKLFTELVNSLKQATRLLVALTSSDDQVALLTADS
jgi:hypothetical protein